MTFGKHPSTILTSLYLKKNHQGANPFDAQILFVGRDPNWSENIEVSVMPIIEEYLSDGVAFWKKHGIHHPFLHPNYKGDGKRYHKIFSKLNIDSQHSEKISFVELIGFPTTGMAKKEPKKFKEYLLSEENSYHLIELDALLNDSDKMIFIAWGLMDDFKFINDKTGLFEKLANFDKTKFDITDLNQSGNIYIHRHFSDAISNSTIEKMAERINEYLNC